MYNLLMEKSIKMKHYFKYKYKDKIEFYLDNNEFVSIVGNSNDFFVDTLLNYNKELTVRSGSNTFKNDNKGQIYKEVAIVLNKNLNIFSAETVMDEIAFPLEGLAYTKDDMIESIVSYSRLFKLDHLLERDPYSLGSSDKAKLKILSYLIIKPKVLVLDNILSELDYNDKLLIIKILNEYKNNGGIIINVTNDIEESLFSDRIIILYDNSLACDGKTLSVLNEEKLLKRLGIGLPFIVELNKYFMDYGLINKYYLKNEKLVGALWK